MYSMQLMLGSGLGSFRGRTEHEAWGGGVEGTRERE